MAVFYQLRHLLVEKGHQQRGNMGAVDISIGHNNDFFITEVFLLIIFFNAAAKSLTHIFDFLVLQNLVQRGAGDVQNLAAQRQNGLGNTVAPHFG